MKLNKRDEQALRAALRRKPRKIHEIRAFLAGRLRSRLTAPSGEMTWQNMRAIDDAVWRSAGSCAASVLTKWKREGLVDNPTRGTWQWVGK